MPRERVDRLSYQDATFAYFDRDAFPYNIGSVGVFEGEMPFEAYVEHVERRLRRVPRYLQRLEPVPAYLGHPVWGADPDFDIYYHIRPAKLPEPADEEALMRFAGKFFATPLDRRRPLWEIRLVRLSGGRTAHVAKVHHCLVDGVGGVALLGAVLDVRPNPRDDPTDPVEVVPAPGRLMRFVDAAFEEIEDIVDTAENVLLGAVYPTRGARWARSVAGSLLAASAHFGLRGKRKPWSTRLTRPSRLAWESVPFDELRQVGRALGGTVNDAVLTVLGGALQRYFAYHDYDTETAVRVLIPVNVRSDEERRSLGNRVSFMLCGVPLADMSPADRFDAVHRQMVALKEQDQAGGVNRLFSALSHLPPPLQRLTAATMRSPNFLSDMVCTNVPGPRIPLYCMGHRMMDHYPWVPIGWRMGMSLAVMSYDRKLYFSFTGDRSVMADLDRLAGFMREAYGELRDAVLEPEVPAAYRASEGRRTEVAAPPDVTGAEDAGDPQSVADTGPGSPR